MAGVDTRPSRAAARLRRMGLGTKASLAACTTVTVLLTLFTSILLHHDHHLLEAELAEKVRLLARGVARAAELGLLTDNLGLQREGAHTATIDPDFLAVQIFGRHGLPTVSELRPGATATLTALKIDLADRLPPHHRVWLPRPKRPVVVGYRVEVPLSKGGGNEELLLDPEAAGGTMSGGAVQVWLTSARIDATFARARHRLVAATMIVLLAVWLLTILGIRRLLRPIRTLVEAMTRVGRGEKTPSLPAVSRDEIGLLTRRFNTMAASLAEYRAATTATREELERRVEERTADLALQRDRAQEAVRARTAFLANTSHELITPLNAILGFTELIQNEGGRLPTEVRRDLGRIHRSATHLQGLIQQLLDYSRMGAGHLVLRRQRVEVAALLDDCLTSTVLLSKKEGVALERELPATLPAMEGDPARLRQAFLNLLANAVKFTERGHITVRARAADDRLIIEVEDTGIGIAEIDRDKVFTAFAQVDDILARHYDGLGLGLPITKEIVELHGGTIDFTSTPGTGSCFTISLPLHPQTDDRDPATTQGT